MDHPTQIFFIENEYHSKASLNTLLSEGAYKFLLEHQYVKVNSDGLIAFEYVGVISHDSTIICVLPKYYGGNFLNFQEKQKKIRFILKVLKKAGMSDRLPDSGFLKISSEVVSEITLADQLLQDFINYGFYQKIRKEVLLNSNGEVHWEKTVSSLDPILSQKSPIYHDRYNYTGITEEFNVIRELHKWVIKFCLLKYGVILDYDISFYEDTYSSLNSFGESSHILTLLERELRYTYIDREINLLKNLHRLISKQSSENKNSLNIYGTGYFHVIWESVCSDSFKNKKEKFTPLIPKPKWHNLSGECVNKDTIEPDILSLNKDETSLFVIDAKYYNLKIKENPYSVSGNPGVGDISKQILYEKAFASMQVPKRYNIFLFPSLIDSIFEIKGTVTFDLLPGHRVYNIFLNPDQIFDSYLQNKYLGYKNLDFIGEQLTNLE